MNVPGGIASRDAEFKPVLPGVAGPADDDLHDQHVLHREPVSLERRDLSRDLPEEFHDLRPLNRAHAGRLGLIHHLEDQVLLRLHSIEVRGDLRAIGAVADDHVVVVGEAVDKDVIEATTGFVADQAVATLPLLHSPDQPRADAIEELPRVAAGDAKPSHVRHIEDASTGACPEVFVADRAVVKRELPAGVVDDLRLMFDMKGVKWRTRQRGGFWHSRTVAVPPPLRHQRPRFQPCGSCGL